MSTLKISSILDQSIDHTTMQLAVVMYSLQMIFCFSTVAHYYLGIVSVECKIIELLPTPLALESTAIVVKSSSSCMKCKSSLQEERGWLL